MPARIVVIEDNPTNLELMAYLLQAFGHHPLEAQDGETGVRLVMHELPDLILCDVQLPGINGYEVARRLKGHPALRHIPLVAVTAYAMVGDRDSLLAAGFDGYIPKPIAPETFVAQVEVFLRPDQVSALRRATVAAPAEPVVAANSKHAAILIVDNVPVNRELMRSILEPSGYQVTLASSVEEALLIARRSPPDLILSDLHMPDQDGFDLLRIVANDPRLRHIPVVIHSATMMTRVDEDRAVALGARRFVVRPIEPQDLLKQIEECLAFRLVPGADPD